MRMKELSEASGVPVATIKFYLRERLLPAGERTHPNQSVYGDAHLRRIRLIRALIEVGGLSVATARASSACSTCRRQSIHDVLGLAQHAMSPRHPESRTDAEFRPLEARSIRDLLDRLGWRVVPGETPDGTVLPPSLSTLAALDQPGLRRHPRAVCPSRRESLHGPTWTRSQPPASTIATRWSRPPSSAWSSARPCTLHLRRMAQEHVSLQRLSRRAADAALPGAPTG